jgi:DNA-binding IclR family transcriptional regulator
VSAKGKRPLAFRVKKKGLDALELFASESDGSTNTDVARTLGRTVSEVFRMQVCLETRGYCSRPHTSTSETQFARSEGMSGGRNAVKVRRTARKLRREINAVLYFGRSHKVFLKMRDAFEE